MAEGRKPDHGRSLVAGNGDLDGTAKPTPAPGRPDDEAPSLFESPRKVALTGLIVLVMFAAIYVLLPKLIGLEDAVEKMGEGEWQWFAVAVGFNVLAFGSYVALFTGFYVDNGAQLPLWDRLPPLAYWLLPAVVGAPITWRALVRNVRADRAGSHASDIESLPSP